MFDASRRIRDVRTVRARVRRQDGQLLGLLRLEQRMLLTASVAGASLVDPSLVDEPLANVVTAAANVSIWPGNPTPKVTSEMNDSNRVELGLKFQSSVAGNVVGIRFYEGSGNSGTHIGHLWTVNGTQLGSVTFSNESGSGWQTANFSSPISISANTTYIISYYAPAGHYSDDVGYFANATSNSYLTALANGTDGGNGVFVYGSDAFPTQSANGTNYWVDVIFAPPAVGPHIVSQSPGARATGVFDATTVAATFDVSVQPGSIVMSLKNSQNATIAGVTAYDDSTHTVTFTPGASLSPGVTYTASLQASDTNGVAMPAAVTWSFTTASVNLTVNGATTYQTIDGFGMNLNSAAWADGNFQGALDTIINKMGAKIFRVIVEPVQGWEDADPNTGQYSNANPNWAYYNQIYSTPKFTNLWNTIGYLNAHGMHVFVNIQGYPPLWMTDASHNLPTSHEDDWVTMVTTMLSYAVNTAHVHVDLFGPLNEQDSPNDSIQGPQVGPAEYVDMMDRVIARMQTYGITGVKLMGPDNAQINTPYMTAMFNDPTFMQQVAHIGIHTYSGDSGATNTTVAGSGYPGLNWWADEYSANGLSFANMDQGQYVPAGQEWAFSKQSFQYLTQLLSQGASAATVWEGVDSFYQLENAWGTWGMLSYDQNTSLYAERLRMYANASVYRFVTPGMRRVSSNDTNANLTQVSFIDPVSGNVVILGLNTGTSAIGINGSMLNGLSNGTLRLYETDGNGQQMTRNADVGVSGGAFSFSLPADTIFVLTSPTDISPPTTPGNVAAAGGINKVAVNWNASTDDTAVSSYTIYRSTSAAVARIAANIAGTVSGAQTTFTDNVTAGTYYYVIEAHDANGNFSGPSIAATGISAPPNTVAGRFLFYGNSAVYAAGSNDTAIAPDKTALLPGQTATFANYSSYSRGINGIMVDITGVVGGISAGDFQVRVGNDNIPANWTAAPAPAVIVRPGAGVNGSTRMELTWDNGVISQEWVQVTVAADVNTGLATPDVFYFGNAIGDTHDSVTDAQVTAADEQAARNNPASLLDAIGPSNLYDFNRDGRVDATDQIIARTHVTDGTSALILLSAPSGGGSLLPDGSDPLAFAVTTAGPVVSFAAPAPSVEKPRLSLPDFLMHTQLAPRYTRPLLNHLRKIRRLIQDERFT